MKGGGVSGSSAVVAGSPSLGFIQEVQSSSFRLQRSRKLSIPAGLRSGMGTLQPKVSLPLTFVSINAREPASQKQGKEGPGLGVEWDDDGGSLWNTRMTPKGLSLSFKSVQLAF